MDRFSTSMCLTVALYSGLASFAVTAQSSHVPGFTPQLLKAPFRLTHQVIPADILPDDGKELVLLGVNDSKQRMVAIYKFDTKSAQYSLAYQHEIPSKYHSFDLSSEYLGQRQTLYFQSSGQVSRYQPTHQQKVFEKVADIDSMLLARYPDFIREDDFVKDINGDQQDDILVSDFRQSHLLLADGAGRFSKLSLPIPAQVQIESNGASYTQTATYFADMNMDNRQDIVTIGEGELQVFYQTPQQKFKTIPEFIPVRQAISGMDWWKKRDAYGEQLDQSDLTYRKVEALKDINNDGVTDLILRYTKSSGVFDRINDYEIFLGQAKQDQLSFANEPSSVVRADGTLTGLKFIDIDDDARDEVLVAGFDIGLSQIIGALLAGSIDQDVYLFKMDEAGHFASQSNISKEVELSFSLTSGQTGNPVVELADINGDGRKDLLLSDGLDSLKIYFGRDHKSLFKSRALTLPFQLPQDGGNLICDDINGDGKEDVLIKYGRQDAKERQRQFRVYLSS